MLTTLITGRCHNKHAVWMKCEKPKNTELGLRCKLIGVNKANLRLKARFGMVLI